MLSVHDLLRKLQINPLYMITYDRFSKFHDKVCLSPLQRADGYKKKERVVSCLTRHYYGNSFAIDNSFIGGSWGKDLTVKTSGDLDLYFILPLHKKEQYANGRQSALLQEMRGSLLLTYPNTVIKADGQVVVVDFNTYKLEIIPAFRWNNKYLICDTNDGGSYKEIDPWAEMQHVADCDRENHYNFRPVVRMLKTWKTYCNVPIKSFHLELLLSKFFNQQYIKDILSGLSVFWVANIIFREVFKYLIAQANSDVIVPGRNERILLGAAWKTRAETAYSNVERANFYDMLKLTDNANEEWKKVFGPLVSLVS